MIIRHDVDDQQYRYLVGRGADVNIPNDNGDTPLIDAAHLGRNEIFEFPLNNGADPGHRNQSGRSAVGMAQGKGNTKAVELPASHKPSKETWR